MALIEIVKLEQAEGKIKEAYDYTTQESSEVPLTFAMFSASPENISIQLDMMKYYMERSGLSMKLLAYIRLLIADGENFPYCINLNRGILASTGVDNEQIESSIVDHDKAALDEKDKVMMKFVVKAVQDPAITEKSDVDELHALGWTDANIYDALYAGMFLLTVGMTFKAFKFGEE
jgi:hypothetical protein